MTEPDVQMANLWEKIDAQRGAPCPSEKRAAPWHPCLKPFVRSYFLG
jgi:hypothetical protein